MAQGKIGPKEAALRAMRESKAEKQVRATKPRSIKVKTVETIQAELSNIPARKSNAPRNSNTASAPFDKTAYQRDYMRQRRARAKATT